MQGEVYNMWRQKPYTSHFVYKIIKRHRTNNIARYLIIIQFKCCDKIERAYSKVKTHVILLLSSTPIPRESGESPPLQEKCELNMMLIGECKKP